MTFPPDFPLRPPKMKFLTEMWHPNGTHGAPPLHSLLSGPSLIFRRRRQETDSYPQFPCAQSTRTESCASRSCMSRARISTGTKTPERGGCPSTRSSRSCVPLSFPFRCQTLQRDRLPSARGLTALLPWFDAKTAHLGHLAAESRYSRYQLTCQRRRCRTSLFPFSRPSSPST